MATLKLVTNIEDKTQVYPLIDVKLCPASKYATVPDLLSGGQRKRKYALAFSMSAFPDFANQPEPIMIGSQMDAILIDADTLEDLRERAVKEVDGMIDQLREALEAAKTAKAKK